jgi:hypothetical protein
MDQVTNKHQNRFYLILSRKRLEDALALPRRAVLKVETYGRLEETEIELIIEIAKDARELEQGINLVFFLTAHLSFIIRAQKKLQQQQQQQQQQHIRQIKRQFCCMLHNYVFMHMHFYCTQSVKSQYNIHKKNYNYSQLCQYTLVHVDSTYK